jgi:hypothetical protein
MGAQTDVSASRKPNRQRGQNCSQPWRKSGTYTARPVPAAYLSATIRVLFCSPPILLSAQAVRKSKAVKRWAPPYQFVALKINVNRTAVSSSHIKLNRHVSRRCPMKMDIFSQSALYEHAGVHTHGYDQDGTLCIFGASNVGWQASDGRLLSDSLSCSMELRHQVQDRHGQNSPWWKDPCDRARCQRSALPRNSSTLAFLQHS